MIVTKDLDVIVEWWIAQQRTRKSRQMEPSIKRLTRKVDKVCEQCVPLSRRPKPQQFGSQKPSTIRANDSGVLSVQTVAFEPT